MLQLITKALSIQEVQAEVFGLVLPEIDPGESECGETWLPLGFSRWKLTELPLV